MGAMVWAGGTEVKRGIGTTILDESEEEAVMYLMIGENTGLQHIPPGPGTVNRELDSGDTGSGSLAHQAISVGEGGVEQGNGHPVGLRKVEVAYSHRRHQVVW